LVEVVKGDSSFSIAAAEALELSYELMSCICGKIWDTNFIKVANFRLQPIQAVGSEKLS
jgi:hypothetical protein